MNENRRRTKGKNQERKHKVVSREGWIAAREKVLKTEKELTSASDELGRKRLLTN
jgi:predicted dithiol-disulfide oxidoreductase (DUF899 family)